MKFLNKLFKKGESNEGAVEPVIEETFPGDDEGESFAGGGAFEQSYGSGYEDQLGPSSQEPAADETHEAGGETGYAQAVPEDYESAPQVEAEFPFESNDKPDWAPEEAPHEWNSLRLKLQADPRSQEHHAAVRRAITLRDERIDFYEELANTYDSEPYHRLSLARAHRAAGQNREAIPHYQRYLRSVMDAEAFEELAEVYSSVGETYLASSARQIAQSIAKGGLCSNS